MIIRGIGGIELKIRMVEQSVVDGDIEMLSKSLVNYSRLRNEIKSHRLTSDESLQLAGYDKQLEKILGTINLNGNKPLRYKF